MARLLYGFFGLLSLENILPMRIMFERFTCFACRIVQFLYLIKYSLKWTRVLQRLRKFTKRANLLRLIWCFVEIRVSFLAVYRLVGERGVKGRSIWKHVPVGRRQQWKRKWWEGHGSTSSSRPYIKIWLGWPKISTFQQARFLFFSELSGSAGYWRVLIRIDFLETNQTC